MGTKSIDGANVYSITWHSQNCFVGFFNIELKNGKQKCFFSCFFLGEESFENTWFFNGFRRQ